MRQDNSIINAKRRRWLNYVAALVVCFSMLLIGAAGAYVVLRGQDINTDLCESNAKVYDTIRDILTTAEQQSLENAVTVFQIEEITRSADQLLALVPTVGCTSSGGPVELEP